MKLRDFTVDHSKLADRGHALGLLPAGADEAGLSSRGDVPILDIAIRDEELSEPDGVNDFTHQLGSGQLDQH